MNGQENIGIGSGDSIAYENGHWSVRKTHFAGEAAKESSGANGGNDADSSTGPGATGNIQAGPNSVEGSV